MMFSRSLFSVAVLLGCITPILTAPHCQPILFSSTLSSTTNCRPLAQKRETNELEARAPHPEVPAVSGPVARAVDS